VLLFLKEVGGIGSAPQFPHSIPEPSLVGEASYKSKPVRCAHYVLLFLKNLLKQVWQKLQKQQNLAIARL
ncbi:hypothetical protein, partial [Sphingobacterium cellulitidis]|uniref:hypothetical protein n=1 Tax=Sphingobacterium cellulitidis TaxID=1768011 RepID=UPI003C79D975